MTAGAIGGAARGLAVRLLSPASTTRLVATFTDPDGNVLGLLPDR